MAIDAKATLLNRVENAIGNVLTVNKTNEIMALLANELDNYIIENSNNITPNHDECLEAFLTAKEIEGRSPLTLYRYKRALTIIMDTIKVPTRQVTVFHLRKYLSDEKARGVSDGTLEGLRQLMCAYFNWLQRETLIDKNPTSNLCAIKCQKKIKTIFSDIDIEKLKMVCSTERDRALILFLNATGCRVSEIVNLNREDVDLIAMHCKVLGKGNKERTVFFDSITAMTLENYLKTRKDNNPALFINKNYKRLLQGGIRLILNNLGKKLELSMFILINFDVL